MPESHSLAGKAVLITGATGFIGSALAARLAREGAKVRGIGRRLDQVAWLREEGVELVSVDILDAGALDGAVDGQEIVFHAAAALGADPEAAHAVNVVATEDLVRAAARAGSSRFVQVSTVGVYDMLDRDVVDETTPLAVTHAATYPRTKALSEKRAFEIGKETGIEVTAARPSMVYGPGHGIWTVGMFQNVCQGKPVFLGDGSSWFNPVYIDDVVDILIRCGASDKAAGEAFNVSSGVTTWREFMGYYGTLCGKEPKGVPILLARLMAAANRIPGVTMPIDGGFIEMATSRKRFPIEKAGRLLGWEPHVALDEGMQRTGAWLKEEGLVPDRGADAPR